MQSHRRTFADRLKQARKDAGYSQSDVADLVPTSPASMAAYEQGARDVPDAVLERLSELYGVHIAVLRYGESVVREAGLSEVRRLILKAASDLADVAELITAADLPPGPVIETSPAPATQQRKRRP